MTKAAPGYVLKKKPEKRLQKKLRNVPGKTVNVRKMRAVSMSVRNASAGNVKGRNVPKRRVKTVSAVRVTGLSKAIIITVHHPPPAAHTVAIPDPGIMLPAPTSRTAPAKQSLSAAIISSVKNSILTALQATQSPSAG